MAVWEVLRSANSDCIAATPLDYRAGYSRTLHEITAYMILDVQLRLIFNILVYDPLLSHGAPPVPLLRHVMLTESGDSAI